VQGDPIGLTTCPQPFDAVLQLPSEMLNWDQRSRIIGFRNTYRLYPGDVFHTLGAKAYPLSPAPYKMPPLHYKMDGQHYRLEDYLQRQNVTGLLILKNGRVAYEYYGGANSEKTLWTSRSVAKSVVSILVGIAIKEGFIGSVADPITRYLPELKGSVWKDVTLRDLLQHTSGVVWNENYADPNSEFAHLTQCEAGAAAYECVLRLVTEVKRKQGVKSGELWSYNTGGAWLVGRVLERSTGMTIAHYLETRLWSRFAMQSDGVWQALLEGQVDMGGHGFNATLRDWGRFALFVANGGQLPNGEKLLPTAWIDQSVTWTKATGSVTPATPDGQFGYQWWFGGVDPSRGGTDNAMQTAKRTFWAEGIFGQAIAINRAERLVMVQWSTWREADTPASLYDEQAPFFNAVAHAVGRAHRSGRKRVNPIRPETARAPPGSSVASAPACARANARRGAPNPEGHRTESAIARASPRPVRR
jgi:CubicO group peptidase (beta-lactamase class C family)